MTNLTTAQTELLNLFALEDGMDPAETAMDANEVAEVTGKSKAAARSALNRLANAGHLDKDEIDGVTVYMAIEEQVTEPAAAETVEAPATMGTGEEIARAGNLILYRDGDDYHVETNRRTWGASLLRAYHEQELCHVKTGAALPCTDRQTQTINLWFDQYAAIQPDHLDGRTGYAVEDFAA